MATCSSFIASKLKSLTFSTSPSTNGYLNSPSSPPPRVPPPPPIQERSIIMSVQGTLKLPPLHLHPSSSMSLKLTVTPALIDITQRRYSGQDFKRGTKDGSPGDEETEHMSALFTILEYLYSGTFCKGNKSRARSCGKVVPRVCSLPIPYVYAEDNRSVRAEEIPCGSTDPDDDNMWREGLSSNADIPGHDDNDLPRPYATEEPRNSNKMWMQLLRLRKRLSEGDEEEKEKLIISHFGNVLSIPSGLTNHRFMGSTKRCIFVGKWKRCVGCNATTTYNLSLAAFFCTRKALGGRKFWGGRSFIEANDARNDAYGSHAGNPKANHWLIIRGGLSTVKIKCVEGKQRLKGQD
ncbi:hypothetical protein Tco_1016722 [Tanacetum coccineum]|uniref:Uncharacterized protein n=1 Tax=Tanacetum coccineum TaxID=301880 RepID=A0ABQ5FS01_9ASTR